MYYTYILQSEATGRYYLGSSDDLERRLRQHNDTRYTGSRTTKRFKGPWRPVYSEPFEARGEAMNRENRVKSWKSRKAIQDLITAQ